MHMHSLQKQLDCMLRPASLFYCPQSYVSIFPPMHQCWMAVWLIGNAVGLINEVTLHRARLVVRRVTVRRYAISVFNQATQANSVWPSLRG